MNAQPGPPNREDASRTAGVRRPEIGPVYERETLLRRVRAARKRLAPGQKAVPKLR